MFLRLNGRCDTYWFRNSFPHIQNGICTHSLFLWGCTIHHSRKGRCGKLKEGKGKNIAGLCITFVFKAYERNWRNTNWLNNNNNKQIYLQPHRVGFTYTVIYKQNKIQGNKMRRNVICKSDTYCDVTWYAKWYILSLVITFLHYIKCRFNRNYCQWYSPHGISELRYLFVRISGNWYLLNLRTSYWLHLWQGRRWVSWCVVSIIFWKYFLHKLSRISFKHGRFVKHKISAYSLPG